jgi:hypothetical protein
MSTNTTSSVVITLPVILLLVSSVNMLCFISTPYFEETPWVGFGHQHRHQGGSFRYTSHSDLSDLLAFLFTTFRPQHHISYQPARFTSRSLSERRIQRVPGARHNPLSVDVSDPREGRCGHLSFGFSRAERFAKRPLRGGLTIHC